MGLALVISMLGEGFETVSIDLRFVDRAKALHFRDAMQWLLLTLESAARGMQMSNDAGSISDIRSESTIEKDVQFEKLRIERIQSIKSQLNQGILKWNATANKSLVSTLYHGKDRQKALNTFEMHNAKIKKYKESVERRYFQYYPGKTFDISLVPAGRTLPVSVDLEAVIKPDSTINTFHELMGSQVKKEWQEKCGLKLQNSFAFQQKSEKLSLLESINKALSENLFLDNAYQIQIDSKMLVSTEEWNQNETAEETEPEFLAKMYLMDAHGRKLSFDEVGSGIGYVLPVLMESLNASNKGKVVFLQQPELHLHPALQASLTDVLIEATADKRIVAETHSEHMILRALKRVRQTTSGTLKDPELKLKPQDIAVNYFEPMPDGGTRVHILRVSDEGDFLDRWPNGFFAERDLELFDE